MIAKLKSVFGIDTRSLAAFRIGIAALVLVDLFDRLRDLKAFYTDAGVMPREWLVQNFSPAWRFLSLNLLGGSATFQIILFAAAGISATALLFGYRTRFAAVLTWLLVTSIQIRNPMIGYGADSLFRALLFWGMFLPLGSRWSLDALRLRGRGGDLPQYVFSAASAALLLQVLFLYWFSAILKTGPEWRDGTAVYYALSDNVLGSGLGRYLLNFPWLIPVLTYGVRGFEFFGTALLLLPVSFGVLRTVGVSLFALLQVGFAFSLNVGLLPFVSIVALLPFLPPRFWRKLPKRASEEIRAAPAVNIVVAALLAHVLLINLGSAVPVFGRTGETPIASLLHLHQSWGPFAPSPPRVNTWHVMSAYDANSSPYTRIRWSNFLETIHFRKYRNYRLSYLGDYLCRSWNETHAVGLAEFKIEFLTQKIPFGDEAEEIENSTILEHSCRGRPNNSPE